MGRRGFPPKPRALRIIEGNPGRRPLNDDEPWYPDVLPAKPTTISAKASPIWDEKIDQMANVGVLREVDGRALWHLCEDEALLSEAYRGLWKLVRSVDKQAKKENRTLPAGPLMAVFGMKGGRQTMAAMRDLSARVIVQRREFGLTPSARTRIQIDSASGGQGGMDSLEAKLCG